jgi:hypothetical protein
MTKGAVVYAPRWSEADVDGGATRAQEARARSSQLRALTGALRGAAWLGRMPCTPRHRCRIGPC